jgi:hypothetical protein
LGYGESDGDWGLGKGFQVTRGRVFNSAVSDDVEVFVGVERISADIRKEIFETSQSNIVDSSTFYCF